MAQTPTEVSLIQQIRDQKAIIARLNSGALSDADKATLASAITTKRAAELQLVGIASAYTATSYATQVTVRTNERSRSGSNNGKGSNGN